MKMNFTLLSLCLIALTPAFAQDTTYFDITWKTTTASKAHYFRITTKTDSGWQVTDHFLTGKLQMTGTYADDSLHIRKGEFSWYDEKAQITHRCTFLKNQLEGPESFYYPNGQLWATGLNHNNRQQGQWLGYYSGGKISGKAVYDTGRQVSARFYKEDGSKNEDIKLFMQDANYPGGIPQFTRFLNKTLRYPDSAVIHEIEGMVIINFKISKEGKPSDWTVEQSVDKYLDEEALRVMRLMIDWEPAIIGGVPYDSYHRQPVIFHL